MNSLEERLNRIKERLKQLGRPHVRIIVVTKTHGPEVISELLRCGHREFGENRQNEARDKFPLVSLENIPTENYPIYHHIGPLQSGASRQIPGLFTWVHGASSLHAIEALADAALKYGRNHTPSTDSALWPMRYLIQVDLTGEESKMGGMSPDELKNLDTFPGNESLHFGGFMTMGPTNMDPVQTREVFHRLRELRDELYPQGELSMGMSSDWEIGVEEGATMIRVGSAIVGTRNDAPWKPGSSN